MTVAVAHLAVGAISVSVSAADDFWHGVDLHGVVAERTLVRAAGYSANDIRYWIAEGAGGTLRSELRLSLFTFAEGFNGSIPVQQGQGQVLHAEGKYLAWQAEMRELPSGFFGIAISVTSVTFRPRWSNPAWELLELQPTSEPDRILAALTVVNTRMGDLEPGALSVTDETIQSHNLPVISKPRPLWLKRVLAVAVSLLAGLLAGTGLWWRLRRPGTLFVHLPANDVVSEPAGSPTNDDSWIHAGTTTTGTVGGGSFGFSMSPGSS